MSETNSSAQKDEFSEILGSHFNLDSMVRETGKLFCLKFLIIMILYIRKVLHLIL